nr:glutaredoxin 2 [Pantoea sp. CCBC3-3-1]
MAFFHPVKFLNNTSELPMKLHIYEHCPFCVRARMIFGLKNIPYATAVIPEGNSEIPLRMVGRKVVPILEKDDGTFMAESMDIVKFVDALSAPRLTDAGIDPAVKQWCDEATKTLFLLAIPRFTQGEFAELATEEAREAYIARERKAFGDLDALMADTPALLSDMHARLETLEPLLAGRTAVDTTDFILFPLLRSLTIVSGVKFGPATLRYLNKLEKEAGVDLLFNQAR